MERRLALLVLAFAACSAEGSPSAEDTGASVGSGPPGATDTSPPPTSPSGEGPQVSPGGTATATGSAPSSSPPEDSGGSSIPSSPGTTSAPPATTPSTPPSSGTGGSPGSDDPPPLNAGGAGGAGSEPRPGDGDGGDDGSPTGADAGSDAVTDAGAGGDGCLPTPSEYRNLFASLLGLTQEQVDTKVELAFQQLFYGGNNQTVYYESGNEGYILDVASNDIRSEGQSYGMMIAVQLDKKHEFDAIWRWSKRVMQQPSGTFGWHATTSGQLLSTGSAPDGEEYFATALIFASQRWGDATGIDYMSEAQRVLAAMYDHDLFDHDQQLVKFVAQSNYTDPSYILPAFYEVWSCFDADAERAAFWKACAETGRAFLPKTVHPETGLAPYLANYDGSPRDNFNSDSYRVVANIMMDHYLYGVDPWQTTFAETYASFFAVNQQSSRPGAEFTLDGMATVSYGSPEAALAAQNATVAFGVPAEQGEYFVQYLWDMDVPSGQYRYYAGMLYLLSLLHVSGNFRLFH